MYRGISKRARLYVRRKAVQEMLSACVIERVSDPTWDNSSNLVTAGGRVVIYTGICRVWEISGAQPFEAGDDFIVQQTTNLSIPWDANPIPRRDDEVRITTSEVDTDLVGRRYRILDVAKAGDLRATRRFVVQGIQEDK